jgi:hypothetical protein
MVALSAWSETDARTVRVRAAGDGQLVTADAALAQVDSGFMYHCSSLNASLANDASFDMAITNPADDYIHMIVEAAGSGTSELYLYEGTAFTGGNAETVFNLKRTSTRLWGGVMVTAPTVSDVGTLLSVQVMPGGARNQASGGSASFSLKWICKAGTNYMVRLTNRSGGAVRASIGCNHYSSGLIADN